MEDLQELAEQIFVNVLGLDLSERAEYLRNVCRNSPEVKARVESMLKADDLAGSFFVRPPINLRPHEKDSKRGTAQDAGYQAPHGVGPRSHIPQFLPGEVLCDRFAVIRFIAKGGMGEVYEVEDRQLRGVHVALKTILSQYADDPVMQERFEREVLNARQVVHPNLCPIYDIFHWKRPEGHLTFLTMKFLAGETLAARLARTGPLPETEASLVIMQAGSGLSAAHNAGILHRDIKSANIIVDGFGERVYACVTDFGLARAAMSETTALTIAGVAGTPGYMAPELFYGGAPAKASDVYAFGVVAYQVLTGHSPQLSMNPAPDDSVEALTRGFPPPWRQLLKGCLEPHPDRRYKDIPTALQSPGQASIQRINNRRRAPLLTLVQLLLGALTLLLVVALVVGLVPPVRRRAASVLPAAQAEKHVAVLPFDNFGSNPENAALADGLMESLAGRLSNLEADNHLLWVVPNSEVRRRNVASPADALKEFGANLVIKGSVQRDGSDIRLTVNLIDARKLRQLGSAEVEDRAGDLSELEDQAVARLAGLIGISASPNASRNTGGSANSAAYEDYLTALGYTERFDKPGNLDRAVTSLERAIKTDPGFALGYAQLGEVYRLKYQVEQNPHWLEEALARCQKAVELDNRLPATFVTLAQIHDVLGKRELALQEFHQALDLDPKNAAALSGLARSFERSGRIADAEKAFQDAAAMSPEDWDGYNSLGGFYDRHGKYTQAIAAYRRALQITPDNAELYSNLAAAYLDAGGQQSLAQAEQALRKSLALNPSYPAYANLGNLYLQEKRYPEAATATEQALKLNGNDYQVWNNLMLAYEGSRQTDKAEEVRRKAEQLVRQVVELKPRDATAQSMLAAFYAQDKLKDKALAGIRTSLALQLDDPNVLGNVATAYELLGDRELALKYAQMSLRKGYALEELAMDPNLQSLIADPRFKPAEK